MAVSMTILRLLRRTVISKIHVHCNRSLFSSDSKTSDSHNEGGKTISRYKIFQDEDSPVILDVAEQQLIHRKKREENILDISQKQESSIIYQRGTTGVFDVEELVETLKKDNGRDIFVVTVPKELKYVDYLVIVTGRSKRHLLGLAEYIRVLYKKKRSATDLIPMIEGETSSEWIAMDLGNIALHIMSEDARLRYDLESLWSVGAKYDLKLQMEDDSIIQLLKKHSILLDDIQPLKGG